MISTDDGSVVDFIHVWVAPVTTMTLQRRDGERIAGTLGLAIGEDITLVPSLFNGAQKLAGLGGHGVDVVERGAVSDAARWLVPIAAACARARPARRPSPSPSATRRASLDVEVVP